MFSGRAGALHAHCDTFRRPAGPSRPVKNLRRAQERESFRTFIISGGGLKTLQVFKPAKSPRVRRGQGDFCVGKRRSPEQKLERAADSVVLPRAKRSQVKLKMRDAGPSGGDTPRPPTCQKYFFDEMHRTAALLSEAHGFLRYHFANALRSAARRALG